MKNKNKIASVLRKKIIHGYQKRKRASILPKNALSEAQLHTCLHTQLKMRSLSTCHVSKKICPLPLTIFHYGGIDDSHLLHKREPFTYGTLKSANLRHQGNTGSIGVLQVAKMNWTLHHRGQKLLLITHDYYIILKRKMFSLLGSPNIDSKCKVVS